MKPPSIDLHCHFIPPGIIDRIRSEGKSHSITVVADEGVSFAGRPPARKWPQGMRDLEDRLRHMDATDVDLQVLSPWIDFSAYALDPEDGAWLARNLNEMTAEAITAYRDRFRAMASVPLQGPELAADELRYALGELGMVAVEIATSVRDGELDDPALEPFWITAEELDVLVLVHPPNMSLGFERLRRSYFLDNIVSNPAEETVAAANLIYGGVLERHPRLKICLTHGGGFLPYQIGRQDRGFAALPDVTAAKVGDAPSTFLRRFFYDTVVHDPRALSFLVGRVGADRVVLGSDYPFPMGDPAPVTTVLEAGLDEATVRAILTDNARAALGLELGDVGRR